MESVADDIAKLLQLPPLDNDIAASVKSAANDHLWSLATFIIRTGAVATTARRETSSSLP
jgi:hypothetical protein